MPTYEYRCDACGHEFEREQRITEDPIKGCPSCKARKARRLISRTSFVLKGGGWYSDLYSSPGSKTDAPAEASAKSDEKSGSSEKADSKPAEKPEKSKPGRSGSTRQKKSRSAA